MDELDLAADHVPDIADALDLSDDAEAKAIQLAERADIQHPINASPTVVAASAVYAGSLLCNQKRTQSEVADAADVSEPSIRRIYRDILEAEGIHTTRGGSTGSVPDTADETPGVIARIRRFVGGIRS